MAPVDIRLRRAASGPVSVPRSPTIVGLASQLRLKKDLWCIESYQVGSICRQNVSQSAHAQSFTHLSEADTCKVETTNVPNADYSEAAVLQRGAIKLAGRANLKTANGDDWVIRPIDVPS